MSTNYLTSNRATLQIDNFPNVNFDITSFNLPNISIGVVEQPTRFNPGKEADNRVSFEDLVVEFIVDEDMSNWKEVFDWITSLGMPSNHQQYRGHKNRNTDGSLIIYTSHNNPIAKIKFYELFPTSLSGIEFSEDISETTIKKATVNFSLLAYEFE